MPDLSPASHAVLVQIVLGSKIDRIPSELLDHRLVRAEVLRGRDGWASMAFKATREGRKVAATIPEPTP